MGRDSPDLTSKMTSRFSSGTMATNKEDHNDMGVYEYGFNLKMKLLIISYCLIRVD